MTTPDDIVEREGIEIQVTRVVDFENGTDGAENVEREVIQTKGHPFNPTEEAQQRLEGRLKSGAISLTVFSDFDVKADREGGRDRVIIPPVEDVEESIDADIYTVIDVTDDTLRLGGVDIQKKTITCNQHDRQDLSDDADTYTYS